MTSAHLFNYEQIEIEHMVIRPDRDDRLAEHVENIRAQAAELRAQTPTLQVIDNLDDPHDPWLEIRGLSEHGLTKAEQDLRTHALPIRRADGTELLTVLTTEMPVIRTRLGSCYPDEGDSGILAIVIP